MAKRISQQQLIEIFSSKILTGGSFESIREARRMAEAILGQKVQPGTLEAKLVDEALEGGFVRVARQMVRAQQDPTSTYEHLIDLYQRQPTLAVRSSTSVAQQSYSTPLPIAYLAASLAGITPEKTVFEPTAGNGALLIKATPVNATVNELNSERASDLRQQGYTVTERDASTYLPQKLHDVVIMNPPFGSVPDGAGGTKRFNTGRYSTTQIDHAIALNALKAMKPEGRAVLILGGKLGDDEATRSNRYNTQQSRAFYFTLYSQYNVASHFSILGDLYRKQGAGFPIDLIVIEGQGKSERSLPAAQVPRIYKSYQELKELLNGIVFEPTQRLGTPGLDGKLPASRTGSLGPGHDSDQSGVPGTALPAGRVDDPRMEGMAGGDRRGISLRPDRPGTVPGRGVPLSTGNQGASPPLERVRSAAQRSIAQQDGPARGYGLSAAGTERSHRSPGILEPDRSNLSRRVADGPERSLLEVSSSGVTAMADETTPRLELSESADQPVAKQAPYIPKSQGRPVDTLIPVNMRASTAKALDNLEQRVGSLDEFVADRLRYSTPEELHKYLSAEQVDATALAVSNLERGSGFVIGDQTGVGKGRVVASMLRYAKGTGRVPIFVTQNNALYADMMRDLGDINMPAFKPFPTDSKLAIPLENGRELKTSPSSHDAEMQTFLDTGSLGEYDGIFTTYSQMQTVRGKETLRRDFLRSFAAKAILIMDESHEAGGTKSEREPKGAVPDRAAFARELIERSEGVFYSSATYAKRPDVMDLYSKTDMRLAVKDMSTLVSMIESGGVPMQQALATQLTEAGQYIRRERSYEGVNFNMETVPVNHELAENVSAILAGILEFDQLKMDAVKDLDGAMKAEAKAILGDNATGSAGASSTNFTAIMHNLIEQSLLAMKAEQTVQKCLSLMRQSRPEKPVIALSSTMGSFIGNHAKQNQLKPGDALNLDMGDLLKRYLERSRDVLLGDPYGQKTRHRLSDKELGPASVFKYEQVLVQIDQIDFSAIPISPIDYLKMRLTQEGYQVDEITGREDIIAYAPDGSTTYEQRTSREVSKASAIKNVKAFNRGDLDVIILNRSGSTGISLHASATFDDQRPRHMIVAQAEKDINQFMQTLGRVHRTGQVVLPSFTLLNADIPAEKRPAAVLVKKMASLNANTTAARSSGISLDKVPDFMNEYGDFVVAELLENKPSLNRKLGDPLESLENPHSSSTSLISRVTGRLPVLPLAEQELVYNLIEHEYTEYVQRQEAMGESNLEASSLDLDARMIARMEVVPATPGSDSPFTRPVYLEIIDAKTQRKPLTTLAAINLVRDELRFTPVERIEDHDFEQVREQAQRISGATRQTLGQDTENYRNAALARKKTEKGTEHVNRRLDEQLQHIDRTLGNFPVGERVRAVTSTGNVFYGVVGRVGNNSHESTENPAVPNHWKMQLILADPARQLTLPLSQINTDHDNGISLIPQASNWDGVDVYDVFDQRQTKNREERQIFTGNLLKAFDKFQGKLINYTDNQGQTRQGLLTPQGFDIEQSLEEQPVTIPTARQVLAFMNEVTQWGGQVKSLDEQLTLKPQLAREGDGFVVQTAKSKQLAGKFYLDPALLSAIGSDFYSVGDRMEAVVPKDRIAGVLKVLMEDKELPLAAFEQREQAREFLGMNLPKLDQIQRGEYEAKGDYTFHVPALTEQTPSLHDPTYGSETTSEAVSEDLPVSSNSERSPPLVSPARAPDLPSTTPLDNEVTSLGKQLYAQLGGNVADLEGELAKGTPTVETSSSSLATAETHSTELASPTRPESTPSQPESPVRIAAAIHQQGRAEKNIAKLLEQAGLAEEVLKGEDFHLKVANEPYTPLVIERHSRHLYLTHYLEQNGDTFVDSEMVLRIANNGSLSLNQTAIQNPFRGGELRGCDRSFAQVFSRNLLQQGFAASALLSKPSVTSSETPGKTDSSSASEPLKSQNTLGNNLKHPPGTPPVLLSPESHSANSVIPSLTQQQKRQELPDSQAESQDAPRLPEPKFDLPKTSQTAPTELASATERTSNLFSRWLPVATALNRPDNYLNRISAISEELKAGQPLSAAAKTAMHRDHDQYDQALSSLRNWFRSARALGKTESYRSWIQKAAEAFKVGEPLSRNVLTSMGQDLDTHQRSVEAVEAWKTVAQALGHSDEYCDRIAKLAEACKKGAPVSERAAIAMRQDLNTYKQSQASGKVMKLNQENSTPEQEIDD